MAEEPRRIIHVKGVGYASQAPDQVTISLILEAQDKDYSQAAGIIADKILQLRKSIADADFDLDELKTDTFYIDPEYEYEFLKDGERREIFKGYVAKHRMKLTFDFITEKFNKAIAALGDCPANPSVVVHFHVKDYAALLARLWESIAKNARHKAEILCKASGFKLGKLINIGCEPNDYHFENSSSRMEALYQAEIDTDLTDMNTKIFIPADIEIKDSIDFYWEILD